jgi:hypothetical protein
MARLHQIPARSYSPLASPPVNDRRLCRLDAIVGREIGKRKFERIPVGEAQLDQTSRDRAVRLSFTPTEKYGRCRIKLNELPSLVADWRG